MKNKYQRLNKKERKKVRDDFFKTDTGIYIKKKLNTSLVCAFLCLLLGIYNLYDAFKNNLTIFDKVYSVTVILFGLLFILMYYKVRSKKVNEYLIKTKTS